MKLYVIAIPFRYIVIFANLFFYDLLLTFIPNCILQGVVTVSIVYKIFLFIQLCSYSIHINYFRLFYVMCHNNHILVILKVNSCSVEKNIMCTSLWYRRWYDLCFDLIIDFVLSICVWLIIRRCYFLLIEYL